MHHAQLFQMRPVQVPLVQIRNADVLLRRSDSRRSNARGGRGNRFRGRIVVAGRKEIEHD